MKTIKMNRNNIIIIIVLIASIDLFNDFRFRLDF